MIGPTVCVNALQQAIDGSRRSTDGNLPNEFVKAWSWLDQFPVNPTTIQLTMRGTEHAT
jgi:hypothetical protein